MPPTAQNPNAVLEHDTPANHPTLGPIRLLRRDLVPVDTVCRVPDVPVEHLIRLSHLRHGLSTNHPNLIFEHDRVMQSARSPQNGLSFVHVSPRFPVGRVPDV